MTSNLAFRFAAVAIVSFIIASKSSATPTEGIARPLVIIISIDGLSEKLLKSVPANDVPNLTRLAREGDQADRAHTIHLAKTVPAHASMLSGVNVEKHARSYNEYDPNLKKLEVPTVFDLAKTNGLRSAALFGKDKLSYLFDTGGLDKNVVPRAWPIGDWWGRLPSVVDSTAIEIIKYDKPDLLFIHYAFVDSIGHIFKWDTAIQRWALRQVDASLGRLLAFLDKNETRGATIGMSTGVHDGYAILVTADHGGHGPSHGQTLPTGELESVETDLFIPWIAYRSRLNGIDNSLRAELIDRKKTVQVYDTAPTAAALLRLPVPMVWDWDGVNRLKLAPGN